MKKIYSILAAALLAFGVSSCDMEKYPYNAVEESKYMTTLNDFSSARVGLYSYYRSITTGGYILTQEFQCDDFLATADYSNSYGNQYRWDFLASDGNVEAFWSTYYKLIARCNYFIGSYEKIKDSDLIDAEDMPTIEAYVGEAYFTRAYSYLQLAGLFCKAYDAASAETDLGLPLQLTYAPSSDASTYPGRSSMKETYAQIMSDINDAAALVNPSLTVGSGQQAINYISEDVVTALKARAALQMKDYATAASAATSLINAGKYPLINDVEQFKSMWSTDMGTEVMWQIYMSSDELGSATGTSFWGQYKQDPSQVRTDFLPSWKLIELHTADDIRFQTFYTPFMLSVSTGAQGAVYMFNKYPGNPDIYTVVNVDYHYVNKSKPFRIAEQYLIAAEAYAAQGNTTEGGKYLNALKKSRIASYTEKEFNSANLLMIEVQDERHKELVGEGFRLVDLKRWGQGVNRANGYQDAALTLLPGADQTTALDKAANDFRMVWPIPKSETDSNPQIKDQQNPGY